MRFFLVLMNCLLAPVLIAQDTSGKSTPESPYVEHEERQFNFFPGGKIEIYINVPGSLKIVGWKKGSVSIEAEKILYYETQEKAKQFLKKSPIRVRYNDTNATIQTTGIPEPPAIMETNLTVYLPGDRTDINARLDRGEFSIDSVNGWVEVAIGQGSLDAKSMAGYFSGRVLKGDISVEMTGTRWNGLEFAAITQQGSAKLILPKDYSANIQLDTGNGKVTIDYPPRIEEGEEVPITVSTHKTAQAVKSPVGKGGAPIRIATNAGEVTLAVKKD
jgi:DUF4097 and DUF4098 domain-containing protein YvlB